MDCNTATHNDSLVLWQRNGALGVIVVSPDLRQLESPLYIVEDDVEQLDTVRALDHSNVLDGHGNVGTISIPHNRPSDEVVGYLLR